MSAILEILGSLHDADVTFETDSRGIFVTIKASPNEDDERVFLIPFEMVPFLHSFLTTYLSTTTKKESKVIE